jgi:transposase
MSRKFKTPDYESTLNSTISLREALPANHLARFVVDIVAQLDLSRIYARYAVLGRPGFAPEILLALLFYGYASGVFSSRKIEKATYENLGFRFVASGFHPDHDTLANFRKTFLTEMQGLFVEIGSLGISVVSPSGGGIQLSKKGLSDQATSNHSVGYT